jgi:hypothetical protein
MVPARRPCANQRWPRAGLRRCPRAVNPSSSRFACVRLARTVSSISLSRNAASYFPRPRLCSQFPISMGPPYHRAGPSECRGRPRVPSRRRASLNRHCASLVPAEQVALLPKPRPHRLSISQRRLTNIAPQADQAPLVRSGISGRGGRRLQSGSLKQCLLGWETDQIQRSRLRPRPGRIAAHQDHEAAFTRVAGVLGFRLRRHRRPTTL